MVYQYLAKNPSDSFNMFIDPALYGLTGEARIYYWGEPEFTRMAKELQEMSHKKVMEDVEKNGPFHNRPENMDISSLIHTKKCLEFGLKDEFDYRDCGITKDEYKLMKSNSLKLLKEVNKYIRIKAKEIMRFRGLTKEEKIKEKICSLKKEKKPIQDRLDSANRRLLQTMSDFDASCAILHRQELDKIEREIKYQLSLLRGSPERLSYDIAAIKRIPMDQLTRINANGFFQDNPFRKEKSPSNSLHWNKKTNKWTDFGSGEYGDNIDLYMVLHQCSLKTALKEMSNIA